MIEAGYCDIAHSRIANYQHAGGQLKITLAIHYYSFFGISGTLDFSIGSTLLYIPLCKSSYFRKGQLKTGIIAKRQTL